MPLEWTHDWTKCPKQATTCPGDKCCEEFPTPADRIAMARAAYMEWSEGAGEPLENFVQDVEMLARAEGLEQKVWVVMWHVEGWGKWLRAVFNTPEAAAQAVALRRDQEEKGAGKWVIEEWPVQG